METNKLSAALKHATSESSKKTKAAVIREIAADIEAATRAGIVRSEIVKTLAESGFVISEKTLTVTLSRVRIKNKSEIKRQPSTSADALQKIGVQTPALPTPSTPEIPLRAMETAVPILSPEDAMYDAALLKDVVQTEPKTGIYKRVQTDQKEFSISDIFKNKPDIEALARIGRKLKK